MMEPEGCKCEPCSDISPDWRIYEPSSDIPCCVKFLDYFKKREVMVYIINLPMPQKELDFPLMKALEKRRSKRKMERRSSFGSFDK